MSCVQFETNAPSRKEAITAPSKTSLQANFPVIERRRRLLNPNLNEWANLRRHRQISPDTQPNRTRKKPSQLLPRPHYRQSPR
ncbi:hypothetical protein AVEN_206910-1 [Araneus ventricosus]|uniref:Uncharacterized protein n=1 Tax=Araneus ventricosus TaxID=182803 RepID=A0A4Y2ME83_ARAVE|nr:hypothetical protein AVEN_206910-1 [Araneus ventricosus]